MKPKVAISLGLILLLVILAVGAGAMRRALSRSPYTYASYDRNAVAQAKASGPLSDEATAKAPPDGLKKQLLTEVNRARYHTGRGTELTSTDHHAHDSTGTELPSYMSFLSNADAQQIEGQPIIVDSIAANPLTMDSLIVNERGKLTASDAAARDKYGAYVESTVTRW